MATIGFKGSYRYLGVACFVYEGLGSLTRKAF